MAFEVRFRMDWTDVLRQDDYRLDIEVDEVDVIMTELGHTMDAFVLNYNENPWVQGFEGVFSFHVEGEFAPGYDPYFMDSQYKEVKIKFYINSVLKNVGWLKPENTQREMNYPFVNYKVSFTDALNDLKELDYVNSVGSKDTLLEVIKRALNTGGITDLDLFIQCNLFEDQLMTETANLFKTFKVPDAAFYEIRDGAKVLDKCFTVIEKCVKPFYCRLAQVNGYWQITNGQEHASQRDIYAFDDLAAVSENQAYDRVVNIDDFHVATGSKPNLTKLPPVRTLIVVHRNKDIGTNEISNSGFDSGTANWNNGDSDDAWTVFNESNGELVVSDNIGTGDPNEDKSFYSDPFNIADIGDGEGFFNWRFKLTLVDATYSSGNLNNNPIYLTVRLTYPNGSFIDSTFIRVYEGTVIYDEPFSEKFPVSQTGDYFLTIFYHHPESGTLDSVQLNFDDIEVTQNATTAEPSDKSYRNTSDTPGYLELEEELFFADGTQASDAGVLMDASNDFSSSWTRYGFSGENESLISQFAKQYLNDRKGYFDKITIQDLIDQNEEIHFNTILEFNSKTYRFIEFSKNYKTKRISGTIQQVADVDVTVTQSLLTLLSQYGTPFSQLKKVTIPGATPNTDGLITTGDQTFEGSKTFNKPIKLGSVTLGSLEDGKFEYDGTDLFFTTGGLRIQINPSYGTYTPVAVAVTNLTSVTAHQCQYTRVGNVVTVSGRIDTVESGTGIVSARIPLPIPSNFTDTSNNECAGTAVSVANEKTAQIIADTTNDTAFLKYNTTVAVSREFWFQFTYTIV